MKDKNDEKAKRNPPNELAQPRHCLHCGHDEVEPVRLGHTNGRNFIERLSNASFFHHFFPKQHRLYGWRCTECGHIMLFTARFLD
jgi:hypothetical protein